MHKPESVLKNETHRIVLDFEIKTDDLILARRPELVIIYYQRVKIKGNERVDKYFDHAGNYETLRPK